MGISIYSITTTNKPVQPLPYMTDLYKSKAFTWALLLIFTIAWFYMLDLRTLVPTDEGRYAEMAREMVASGDWITTRLNGIKYFEKPPLQTWMNALTFELFGMGEWQARFWTGLSGFLGIVLTAYWATVVTTRSQSGEVCASATSSLFLRSAAPSMAADWGDGAG